MLSRSALLSKCAQTSTKRAPACYPRRYASSNSNTETTTNKNKDLAAASTESRSPDPPKKKKTMAEIDEELRLKMAGLSGDGGESGVEFEDGQPVSMKRSVKNNMFRYI